MIRRVEWAESAIDDLEDAIGFIARDNPHPARRVAKAIDVTARQLGELPTGRPGRIAGTYEKKVSRLPYAIAYALPDATRLVILRVIHNARDWPDGVWPEN